MGAYSGYVIQKALTEDESFNFLYGRWVQGQPSAFSDLRLVDRRIQYTTRSPLTRIKFQAHLPRMLSAGFIGAFWFLHYSQQKYSRIRNSFQSPSSGHFDSYPRERKFFRKVPQCFNPLHTLHEHSGTCRGFLILTLTTICTQIPRQPVSIPFIGAFWFLLFGAGDRVIGRYKFQSPSYPPRTFGYMSGLFDSYSQAITSSSMPMVIVSIPFIGAFWFLPKASLAHFQFGGSSFNPLHRGFLILTKSGLILLYRGFMFQSPSSGHFDSY